MRKAAEGPPLPSESLTRIPVPIVVTGPTASGKTELALRLARALDGEIISADSRQMYKDLAAGTDKPAGSWEGETYRVEGVPYHLVDFLDVTQTFSAGEFARYAKPLMKEIRARGRVPILAGGTGLYLKALLDGLDEMPPADEKVRAKLRAEAEANGRAALHARLQAVDPEAAKTIPANNIQRVIRALEVYVLTGKPISSLWTRNKTAPAPGGSTALTAGSVEAIVVGLRWDKDLLDARIKKRCAAVFPSMIEEARALLARGVPPDSPGLLSLGYPEAVATLNGKASAAEALRLYQTSVTQYAKRQRTWFRKEQIHWLDIASPSDWKPGALAAQVVDLHNHLIT